MSHFAKYCKQNHSTTFDFLVIFCSFCVYSLVPGVWHPVLISTPTHTIPGVLHTRCQCPLGLIPHFYYNLGYSYKEIGNSRVNALSGLYLISTVPLQKPRFYAVSRACFCRYLSEYSDSSRFSCMLTFWTYLMRCTYP